MCVVGEVLGGLHGGLAQRLHKAVRSRRGTTGNNAYLAHLRQDLTAYIDRRERHHNESDALTTRRTNTPVNRSSHQLVQSEGYQLCVTLCDLRPNEFLRHRQTLNSCMLISLRTKDGCILFSPERRLASPR